MSHPDIPDGRDLFTAPAEAALRRASAAKKVVKKRSAAPSVKVAGLRDAKKKNKKPVLTVQAKVAGARDAKKRKKRLPPPKKIAKSKKKR